MNIMNILDKPFELQKEMTRIRKEIEIRESKIGSLSVVFEEVKSKNNNSLVEMHVTEIISLKEKLKNVEAECVDLAYTIKKILDESSLTNLENRVIFFKKVLLFNFNEIAYIESYSKSKICDIFKSGVEKLKKSTVIPCSTRNERKIHLKPCQ